MRGAWRATAAALSLLLALGCGQKKEGGGEAAGITVGHVASMTGDTATFGRSADQGIRMAVEEINAAGGVLGRPLDVVTEDDRSVTEEARTAAQKLIQR